jgi:hypothetical protein
MENVTSTPESVASINGDRIQRSTNPPCGTWKRALPWTFSSVGCQGSMFLLLSPWVT